MTYSKGPWIYDAESGEIHTKDRTGFWGPDHEPVVVATVEQLDGVNNGPLLAAAPKLLDALKRLVSAYSVSHSTKTRKSCWDQALEAIDEAEGRE